MTNITIAPGHLSFADMAAALEGPLKISFGEDHLKGVDASAAVIANIVAKGETVYGVNTGFGLLASQKISTEDLATLQKNLVLSHAAGTGEPLDAPTVRLILLLKAASLARGYSGVRREVIAMLGALLEQGIVPNIPTQGSVGASGDLAPLAHMAAAMIGVGTVFLDGEEVPATEALAAKGLAPITLGPKEGLALLNGTQVSTAIAIRNLFRLRRLFRAAVLTGALSTDAVKGSDTPFDARIHEIRGQDGQIVIARLFRSIHGGSEIRQSHIDCDRVQDPYSIRCQPQVMGAALDAAKDAARHLHTEANAVSDNPLVFVDPIGTGGEVLSGGNFHAEPVAIAADLLAIAASEIGALAERRIALLIDGHLSNLPPFLVKNGGLNSGFMIAQVTAAALASENKVFAHPASVDSLPTSANQEDHVSMATFAARKLTPILDNIEGILAIEYLAAATGIDFLRPLKSSETLEGFIAALRKSVPPYTEDRFFAPDIEAARAILKSDVIDDLIGVATTDWEAI
jgi:histidine ammonia-lyase